MIKKLFSFIFCLAPVGAMAATATEYKPDPGETAVKFDNGLTIAQDGQSAKIINRDEGTPTIGIIAGQNGLNIANILVGGSSSAENGYLYIDPTTASSTTGFSIKSQGNITVGYLLQINAGQTLAIDTAKTDNSTINVTLGNAAAIDGENAPIPAIINSGNLTFTNIGAFTANNSIRNEETATSLNINAESVAITHGSVENRGGDVTITATNGDITLADTTNPTAPVYGTIISSNNATSTNITGSGALTTGGISNQSGTMFVNMTGNITSNRDTTGQISGVISNSSATTTNMQFGSESNSLETSFGIIGNDITADRITNTAGIMRIMAGGDLTVTGGDTNNASIVNGGDLYINVDGQTSLANGFNLSPMGVNNIFSLTTGTLDATTATSDAWLHLFSNKLKNFTVNINSGDLALNNTDIVNGKSYTDDENSSANMTISAQNITAKSVTNSGLEMNIIANGKADEGNIIITNGVTGTSGTTYITASNTITTGAVTNNADMTINSPLGTTVASVSNTGNLELLSATDANGSVKVGTTSGTDFAGGSVTNSGKLTINAKDITIGDLTNTDGITTIKGSDTNNGSLKTGKIAVKGGTVDITSLIGEITVTDELSVKKTSDSTNGGILKIGAATKALTVSGNGIAGIDGDIKMSATHTETLGSVNIATVGAPFTLTAKNNITVGGNISATDTDFRTLNLISDSINITGNVSASNGGRLQFGDTDNATNITISGNLIANDPTQPGDQTSADGARGIEIYSVANTPIYVGQMSGNGMFVIHGDKIVTTNGDINIENSITFNGQTAPNGLIVLDSTDFTLDTKNANDAGTNQNTGSITIGGVKLGASNKLHLISSKDITISGQIMDTNASAPTLNGYLELIADNTATITQPVTVSENATLSIDAADISTNDINNSGTTTLTAGNITSGAITANAGKMSVTADTITANGAISVTGDLVQNTTVTTPADDPNGALNILKDGTITAKSLSVTNDFIADSGSVKYILTDGDAKITKDLTIANNASVTIDAANVISATNIINNNELNLVAGTEISATSIKSVGDMLLDSGNGYTTATEIDFTGKTTLAGAGLSTQNDFDQQMLYQKYNGTLAAGDVNVNSNKYAITARNIDVTGISQTSGQMTLNTPNINVAKNIDATDLRIATNSVGEWPAKDWLTVNVNGNVSGNVQFVGLEHMTIGGDYTYNSNSGLTMAILPYATGDGSSTRDYWASVSLIDDKTLGQISHNPDLHPNPEPLISVGGTFITDMNNDLDPETGLLTDGQMGVQIFNMIDQGTAIWLLNARGGIRENGTKIRNVAVKFCNADGTKCFDYFKPTPNLNETGDDLPAYISVRDHDDDGVYDSLYLVFDPRFGGPVEVFKIQPIVGREDDHTKGEYTTAGALDNMIAGGLADAKFHNRTPIEAIPVAFAGTNMENAATEIYNRMEYYNSSRDGRGLARISRLFQPREIEQMTGSVVLNEHTSFRDFEDHMMDEFIWNRNRNLRKAWGEFDFGMIRQDVADNKRVSANRFSFTGGYDWQETDTLILGLAGRVSHISGDNKDDMEIGYIPGQSITGNVNVDVADTNFGIGAYLLQNLGTKMRAYGNAFLDLHWLDVTRDQTYMSKIDGDGTAFSLISEWGLMHDWLNQYIVGNAYARIGYNFGFSVTEKAAGDDYMKLKSDGYFILTPGYSLTAQKRIYPSAWFQMRPYASIGVEYDVFGAPDNAKYKFAAANGFTKYDIDIDPLWANIGGGIEFLSATGVQVGLDYRYQYNADIQMHKIKLSGSYRF